MGYGFKVGGGAAFKAFINVQANSGVTVRLLLNGEVVSTATADNNGICSFVCKKKGTYTINQEGLISVEQVVNVNKQTYNVDCVYIRPATNLSAEGYSTGVAMVFWNAETEDVYNSGSSVFVSGSQVWTGTAASMSSIARTASEIVKGFTNNVPSGTKTFVRKNYVNINGRTFYSSEKSASYTYTSYAGNANTTTVGDTTFVIPTGVRVIHCFVVGGGGGGGYGRGSYPGAGGGGGYTATAKNVAVTPGQTIKRTVGAGGAGATTYAPTRGGTGGTSAVYNVSTGQSIISAAGGEGGYGGAEGYNGTKYHMGGNGGSGGGAPGSSNAFRVNNGRGAYGGSDGGNGQAGSTESSHGYYGGTGQGSTTRAFGESTGTLYASGGSGGTRYADYTGCPSVGNGAGAGGDVKCAGGNATNGTGSGGGGAGSYGSGSTSGGYIGGNGGSGIVLVKWD